MDQKIYGVVADHEREGSKFFVVVANTAEEAERYVLEMLDDDWVVAYATNASDLILDQYNGLAELTTG